MRSVKRKPGLSAQPSRSVALVTCAELPELDADTRRVRDSLVARGLSTTAAVWDDRSINWDAFDVVVVRSCWDYVQRRDEFLRWAQRVPNLVNSAPVLDWNTHKQYLRDLAERGVPTVPTTWLQPDETWSAPHGGQWVIKPAVSLASLDTGRYRLFDPEERRLAIAHVQRLQSADRCVMVQPYIEQIDAQGERSLVFLGGEYSHAIRKSAVLRGPDHGVDRRFLPGGGMQLRTHVPTASELALAQRVLRCVPCDLADLLYARVDLVPGADEQPLLMELELTEPQLFLHASGAAERLAALIVSRASCFT